MDIDNGTSVQIDPACVDSILKERISPRKILEDVKYFKVNKDLMVLEKHIKALQEEDYNTVEPEELNYTDDLNECMRYVTNYIFDLALYYVDEQIVFRKILFLLAEKKLNILEMENLESCDLRLSVINNGCILTKMCIDNNAYFKMEYYICQILKELEILEKVYDKTHPLYKNIFHKRTLITMYNIEKKMKENKLEEALLELQKQKECVMEFKQYRDYFVGLCYNLSLKCNLEENDCDALTALLIAYDVCKIAEYLSENMKTVLHFMLSLCLKYNPSENWRHAIDALDLVNEVDMFYIIGKLKLAFIAQEERHVEDALNRAAEWENIGVEHVHAITELLQSNKLSARAAEFIRTVRCRPFPNSDKFLLKKLEIQLYISQNDRRVFSLLENSIEMIKSSDISKTSVQSLYKMLASHAGIQMKEKMFKESLTWYRYCSELCEVADLELSLSNHAQTRMCLCYIEMNEWKLAEQCFVKLKKGSDPLHVYVALQIAFMRGDGKLAEETLKTCDDGGDKTRDVLLSCSQRALLSGKKDVLFKILEVLLLKYQASEGSVLPAELAQCLMGLCIDVSSDEDMQQKFLLYMDKALDVLQKSPKHPESAELCQWFSRVSWNLALTPDVEVKYMFEFFMRCCCFCEISLRNLNRLKNALVLAAASGLHMARRTSTKERSEILEKVTTIIEKCKSLETGANTNLLRLLCLYEIETKCHTKKLCDGTRDVLNLPSMDVKTLEHVAAIVHEFAPRNYDVIKESLKAAVQKISESDDERSSEASKTFHSLIQVLFHIQEYLSPSVEEENLQLCNNLLNLIENKAFENYPQLEILWVMTKCWNWGVRKLTLDDSKKARKWCSIAMSFLQKLDTLKSLHEKKLSDMYSAYFPEIEKE